MTLERHVFAFFLADFVWAIAILCQLGPIAREYAKLKGAEHDIVGPITQYVQSVVAVFILVIIFKVFECLLVAFEVCKDKFGKSVHVPLALLNIIYAILMLTLVIVLGKIYDASVSSLSTSDAKLGWVIASGPLALYVLSLVWHVFLTAAHIHHAMKKKVASVAFTLPSTS